MPELEDRPYADSGPEYSSWLRALVESVPLGLCLLDGDQRLLLCNEAGATLLRLLLPDAGGEPPQPGLRLTTLAGAPFASFLDNARREITLEEPAPRHIVATLYPVRPPALLHHREPAHALVLRDVTERRQRSELSRQQERLAAVGQLAAGVAHDFNNILSSIILYAQLLESEPQLSAGGQRRLQVIQDQTRRASDLVRQLLDFSRRSVMQRDEVDLVALCYELVEGWRNTLSATVDVTFHHHAGSYLVHGDASRLKQMLLNLALNAQEAMPRGGRLALSLSHHRIGPHDTVPQLGMEPGLWLRLTVVDSGAGIAPEALPHVFEPFFSTKPLHEGAGLGLAQVHGIVHQHGGHVKIDSEPHKGTVVTIYLPLQRDSAPPPTGAAQADRPVVLVVEQDNLLRKALGDALQEVIARLDHRLLLVAGGQEALALVRRQKLRPALVVGDLALPQMSGLALLQGLRSHNPACRMIIVSSYPMPANSANLHAAGIAAWLPKPFAIDELVAQVEALLSSPV